MSNGVRDEHDGQILLQVATYCGPGSGNLQPGTRGVTGTIPAKTGMFKEKRGFWPLSLAAKGGTPWTIDADHVTDISLPTVTDFLEAYGAEMSSRSGGIISDFEMSIAGLYVDLGKGYKILSVFTAERKVSGSKFRYRFRRLWTTYGFAVPGKELLTMRL